MWPAGHVSARTHARVCVCVRACAQRIAKGNEEKLHVTAPSPVHSCCHPRPVKGLHKHTGLVDPAPPGGISGRSTASVVFDDRFSTHPLPLLPSSLSTHRRAHARTHTHIGGICLGRNQQHLEKLVGSFGMSSSGAWVAAGALRGALGVRTHVKTTLNSRTWQFPNAISLKPKSGNNSFGDRSLREGSPFRPSQPICFPLSTTAWGIHRWRV